eukprot:2549980-Rhodomonas_salina.1
MNKHRRRQGEDERKKANCLVSDGEREWETESKGGSRHGDALLARAASSSARAASSSHKPHATPNAASRCSHMPSSPAVAAAAPLRFHASLVSSQSTFARPGSRPAAHFLRPHPLP